ncbi:MAG: hypothetical protein ACYSTS_10360 [Planctomycetota bacterium]|jgi:hypothetical protein
MSDKGTKRMLYISKFAEGTEVFSTGVNREDYTSNDAYCKAVLEQMIKAKELYYEALDLADSQADRESVRDMIDNAERLVRDTQINRAKGKTDEEYD